MTTTSNISIPNIINWVKIQKRECKLNWEVLKRRAFKTVLLYHNEIEQTDEFVSKKDRTHHKYTLDFSISKLYTLTGVYYRCSVPNFSSCDKNLYVAMWDCIKYMDKKSPGHFRLVDELIVRDIWRKM